METLGSFSESRKHLLMGNFYRRKKHWSGELQFFSKGALEINEDGETARNPDIVKLLIDFSSRKLQFNQQTPETKRKFRCATLAFGLDEIKCHKKFRISQNPFPKM